MNGYEYAVLLVTVPKVGTVLEVASAIAGSLAFVSGLVGGFTYGDSHVENAHKQAKKIFKPAAWAFAAVLPFAILWPTQTDLVTILGGGVAYEIVTSDEAKEIGELSLEFVKRKLKEED